MLVRDVMTRGAECVHPGDTLATAAEKMKSFNVGSLPVCDADLLGGIVTDRDITIRGVAAGFDPKSTPVEEVMTPGITYCYEDQSVDVAARLMEENQVRRLAVLNRDKRLVGIVSLGDLAVKTGNGLSREALEAVSEPAAPHRV